MTINPIFSDMVQHQPVSVASAATCDIGAAISDVITVTGTTTITSFGTKTNKLRYVKFAAALTLTHNATSLILPTAANITTAAGDTAIFASDGSGNWTCLSYMRANGQALSAPVPLVISSNAQALQMTDDTTAMSPAKVAAAIGPDLRTLSVLVSELKADRISMSSGFFDPLQDTSDIATLTNTDIGTAGKIKPSTNGGINEIPTMTGDTTSGITISDSYHYSGRDAWHACDSSVGFGAGQCWDTYGSAVASMVVDFGAGNAKTISIVALASSNGITSAYLQGSNDGTNYTTLWTGTIPNDSIQHSYSISSPTTYRYYKFGGTATNGSYFYVDQFELRSSLVYNNATIVSNNFVAAAPPSSVRALLQLKPIDSIVINTDVVMYVSRNGGSTWTAATLAPETVLADGTTLYIHDGISVTGQSSGTNMAYKIMTANNKNVDINGVGLKWA